MKMIPLFRCTSMKKAIAFYTETLDFELSAESTPDDVVVVLSNGNAELMLSTIDGLSGNVTNIVVENIDSLFQKYIQRGLDISTKSESPIHQGPLNQTWGTREFYVTDPDCNTLRFQQR
ncbi:MAG: VOC family protein [Chitinophagales bacterium]|nr:VOC family protein [Chitinophagales bacterium]